MKLEAIRKVVEVAVERNFITLGMVTYGEEERIDEIVTCIQNGIDERNKKAIDELENDFIDELHSIADWTTKDEDDKERPLTVKEVIEIIDTKFMTLLAEKADILDQ